MRQGRKSWSNIAMDFLGMMGRRVSKFRLKTGLVAQAYHPELWEAESGGLQVQSQPGQLSKILSQNLKITEKELGIQLVLALVCVRDWVQSPVPPPQAYNTHMYTFQTAFWLRFYKYKKLGNYTNSYSFSFFLSFFFPYNMFSLPLGSTMTIPFWKYQDSSQRIWLIRVFRIHSSFW